jgi:hypothetical protein
METEWTTVNRSGYVPPHKRAEMDKAAKEAKKNKFDVNDAEDFPTLSVAPTKTVGGWGGTSTTKPSFTQTIHNLIALEQQTEAEREALREAAREMDGWTVLNVKKFTKEDYIAFNERMASSLKQEREHYAMMNIGLQKTPEEMLKFNDDFSDGCSDDLSDGCSISDDESE